jgi:S1-C subfamily serine protease
MKKIPISFIATALLCSSLLATTGSDQINLTVKGHHNDNTRILDNNSVLFSGDSFQLSVEVQAELYIYAFLIDSNNNIQQLKPPNSSSLVRKDQSISFPSDNPGNWYQLDENAGEETLIIVSSPSKLDTTQIINADQLNALEAGEVTLEKFTIKHLGTKIAMRGINAPLTVNTEDFLKTPTTLPSHISENITLKLDNDNLTSKTVLTILKDSITNEFNKDTVTRGVKEVRIFRDSAPSVVLISRTGGTGTGALISEDGLIFTNSHVVGEAKKVDVYFKPNRPGNYSHNEYVSGAVINNNKIVDLALIKLLKSPVGVKPLSLANVDSLEIGQDVHAIGHPYGGADWSYTRGYIGQLIKDYEWEIDDIVHKAKMVIQSQTPITYGNSGGPLLNDNGSIIGVNTFGGDYAGATYAVSVQDLKLFLNEKIKPPPASTKTIEAKRASQQYGSNVVKIKKYHYDNDGVKDTLYYIDDDNTGYIELIVVQITNTDEIIVILDYDEDGFWNEKRLNTNSNPNFDFYIYDEDGDGKADYYGYDDDEDGEVDRYEAV